MAGRPAKAGPHPTPSPSGLGDWSSRPPEKAFPRACQGEAWAALGKRGLVRERLIHPHTPRRLLPSPYPGCPVLARRPPQSNGPGRRRCNGERARRLPGGLTVFGEGNDTGGPSGSGRRVLPAAGGGEEGGERVGPAPLRSGTHDGSSGGTGGRGAGPHLRASRAPRPAPRTRSSGRLA